MFQDWLCMLVGGMLGGADGLSGMWVSGEEKSMSAMSDTGAVMLAGAAVLLEGRRVYPSHSPPCTERNPRISPRSSVVIVAFLLEGVAWYAASRRHKRVMGMLRRMQRLRDIFVFVDPTLLALVSLLFLLLFFLGLFVMLAQQ